MHKSLIAGLASALTLGVCASSAQIQAPAAVAADEQALVERAAGARYVLLGESTHGTREYYLERARLTEALVTAHGARALAIEGDWSGAARVNRYVRGLGSDASADQALSDFDEFPVWMWRNAEFRDFVERLRQINLTRPPEQRVGVYALDVYDIFDAARAVTDHLREVDPAAARQVAGHYRCLRRYETTDAYAEAIMSGDRGCQKQAQAALDVVAALPKTGGAEERFAIERAAATVVGGEEYFRVQIETGYSWNARDRRMAQAARQISQHVAGPVVIWAHNTHVGDARHTSQRDQGELSLGQLLREEGGAFLLGFLTAGGTVLAGDHWGDRARRHTLQAPLPSSHEAELAARPGARQVWLHNPAARAGRRLQRAVGVIYSRREREAHYIEAEPERQFDALVFIRETSALTALPRARR